MDEEQKREPKISIPEAIFIGLFIAFLDVLDLIPLVGDVTDIVAAPVMFYLYMKGVNGVLFGISELLDLIPVVQEFPSRSIAWWITVGIDHFAPAKVAELAEKAGNLSSPEGLEGLVEGGAVGAMAMDATAVAATASGSAESSGFSVIQGGKNADMAESGKMTDSQIKGGAGESESEQEAKKLEKDMQTEPEREPGKVLQEKLLGSEPLKDAA